MCQFLELFPFCFTRFIRLERLAVLLQRAGIRVNVPDSEESLLVRFAQCTFSTAFQSPYSIHSVAVYLYKVLNWLT